jgi:hypothetical protein
VANRVNNLGRCHVKVLDDIDLKLDGKDELMLHKDQLETLNIEDQTCN